MGDAYCGPVILSCGCGKAPASPNQPSPDPVVTGIEGETGAAQ